MKIFLSIIGFIGLSQYVNSQDTVVVNLDQVIKQSITQSVDAVVARNEFKTSYWEYKIYKAELLPEVTLSGTLPYYSRSYNQFQNADGTYTYVNNDYSKLDAALSVNQNIPWTGGELSVKSSLQRLEQYGNNSSIKFMSIPAEITFKQPVFGFNRMKWLQKIEPIKYQEAKAKYIADLEEVANIAITYYFNLLLGEINLEIASQNLKNIQRLYTIAEGKRKIGQISENDLLQLKTSLLNADAYLTDAQLELKSRMFQMRSFLRYEESLFIKPLEPSILIDNALVLNYSEVLSLANLNNPFSKNIHRRNLQAMRDVNQAKAERFNADLFVSLGMSGQNEALRPAYQDLRNNQIVNLGIRIPLLDWGRAKGKIKVAESNREVVISKIEKEQMDFNQNVYMQVENFNNQFRQLSLAKQTDEIAQQRYNISIEAFVLGKIDVLNFNDAQSAKDKARRNYIEQMFLLWSYYYQIRGLTLHDFVKNKSIFADYENIIQ